MKKLAFLLSALVSFTSMANSENSIDEKSEKSPKIPKSVYERLEERGRVEIKESADSGRTGGGTKTDKIEH